MNTRTIPELGSDVKPHDVNSGVPLMTLEAFAQASGLSVGTLRAQVYRGYWPTKKVGKKVMVDIVALRLEAIQRYQER